MTASIDADVVERGSGESRDHHDVACPFCGLLCDDLHVRASGPRLALVGTPCPKAAAGFERLVPAARPQHHGHDVALDDAIAAAAGMLRGAKAPMIGGLATDVAGLRAALALADRVGGVVDHALSEAALGNVDVLQTTGWILSTLTEVRNRADLVIVVASDIARVHPRFFERILAPDRTLLSEQPLRRTVVFIGEDLGMAAAVGPGIAETVHLRCPNAHVGAVIGALKAELKGSRVAASHAAGVPTADIAALAERCRKAAYGVVAWVPSALDRATAGVTVQLIADLVRDLNKTQRFAGLTLGGDEAAASAASVCCWQSGYPLRVDFAGGTPRYDPVRNSIPRMLAAGEGDLLVWIASISPSLAPPPAARIPTILLGTPGLALSGPVTVSIPVGTPGLDHAGRLIRHDSVVSLPLRKLRPTQLPSVADVLGAIEAAL